MRLNDEIIGIGLVVVNVTEHRRAEDFRTVVMDNMAEGLYVMDGEGRITFMNATASRMLGWTSDELHGRPAHAAIHSLHGAALVFRDATEEQAERSRLQRESSTRLPG